MTLTIQVKLLPTEAQAKLLDETMSEYISLTNDILDYAIACAEMPRLSSATVKAKLPAVLRCQCVVDAKSIYRMVTKKNSRFNGRFPTLRRPIAVWNNQNYAVETDFISIPLWSDGKTRRTQIKAIIPADTLAKLHNNKLGSLRITKKNRKYIAQIAYESIETMSEGTATMGIDLGIKCPAVAVFESGETKFYGNGRHNKFVRRKHRSRRKKLGKAKKVSAIRKSEDKEQRWMRDQDHKISRAIVNDAVLKGVGIIKLESLSGVRKTTRKSRKNNQSLHSWSFYRLMSFIEYKARLVGIDVVYVNPAYTSQTYPHCGQRNHARDRRYVCSHCGYSGHRDRIGAANILAA